MIEEWCSFRPNENRRTQIRRIVETTQFLKYLSERGVDVHLPRPTRNSRRGGAFVPHIFSNEELRRFFGECDQISARTPSMMPVMLPVLFRLLLGCGLRISEALGLRLGDTDLDTGILVIRKSFLLSGNQNSIKTGSSPCRIHCWPYFADTAPLTTRYRKATKNHFSLTGTDAQSVRTICTDGSER